MDLIRRIKVPSDVFVLVPSLWLDIDDNEPGPKGVGLFKVIARSDNEQVLVDALRVACADHTLADRPIVVGIGNKSVPYAVDVRAATLDIYITINRYSDDIPRLVRTMLLTASGIDMPAKSFEKLDDREGGEL